MNKEIASTAWAFVKVDQSDKPTHTEVATLAHLWRVQIMTNEALDEGSKEHCSLVALKLHSGLTHQIQVHMMAFGHALVCDQKYEGSSFNAHRLWCLWNFLHEYLVNRAWSFETAGQSKRI